MTKPPPKQAPLSQAAATPSEAEPSPGDRGPSLDAQGRLHAPGKTFKPSPAAASGIDFARPPVPRKAPEPVATSVPVERVPLELPARGPAKRTLRFSRVLGLLILGALGGAVGFVWKALPQQAVTRPLLTVTSEPSGAEVFINGNNVGQTPLFMDNVWTAGEVPIELRRRGYRAHQGSFDGGSDVKLEIELERVKPLKGP